MSEYTAREQADILAELQDWSEVEASNIEGSFEYDVLASNSIEFAKVEVELEQLYKAVFADTSWGDFLTLQAAESGVIRKSATSAIGTVTVSGTGTVSAGSIFATAAGVRFTADEDTVITGSGDVAVTASVAGTSGNVAAGTIVNIPLSIPGITAVTNAEAMTDGYDEESDEDLLSRYLIKVRMPATSGNPWHYYEWATAVEGVGSARIIRAWNGPNTVKVIIVDSNLAEASDTLVEKVAAYIEENRPIGAKVTVVSATAHKINVSARVTLGSFDEAAFTSAVSAYLLTLARNAVAVSSTASSAAQYVSLAQIGSLILTAGGAKDYDSLLINGEAANVPLGTEEVPSLGEVEIDVV